MRLKCAVFCLLSIVPLSRITAQSDYTIQQIHFLPPTFYVGDKVEARIRLAAAEGFVPAEPTELPAPAAIQIRDVRIIPISQEYDIRITFSSYETGKGELPPIALGDITLKGVEITTESMLEEDTVKIEESFGPALLPGTKLLLALAIGALLIVPVFTVLLVIWIRRLAKHFISERKEKRPFKVLTLVLNELANPPSRVKNREFYIELTDAFREYLSARLEVNLRTSTASELRGSLAMQFTGVAPVEKILAELTRFDAVKFGNLGVSSRGRKSDIRKVRDAAEAIEMWRQEAKEHVDS